MEQNEKLRALETLQKKLYAYNCASNSLYLDAVTVAPKNTAEGRGVALSILAGELQKLMTAPETLALVEELYARRETLDTLHRREVEELRRSAAITYTVGSDATVHTLTLEDMDKGAQTINEDGNCVEVEENGVPGLMVFTGLAGNETYRWTITADCDFEGSIIASAPLTALDFQLSANGAESTVLRPQSGRQYAVRYYFDTVPERTGDHYFLEMRELAVNQTADTFPVPAGGSLAPSGSYHVTAVLVEKVTGDFNGDGTISEDEYSWVTVDTQTSGGTVAYVNTMQPDAPGTLVSSQSPPSACPVTGIAGRKGYCSIQVEKENMNSAVGYCRRILSVLETHEIPFDHIATGLGSISFIAPAAAVSACREALLSDISAAVRPDSICVADGLAMVSIVGRDMAGKPGVSGRLLCALGRAGINVRMIVQGTREINITVGISEPEYEKAVHAVHGEFFPEAPQ